MAQVQSWEALDTLRLMIVLSCVKIVHNLRDGERLQNCLDQHINALYVSIEDSRP